MRSSFDITTDSEKAIKKLGIKRDLTREERIKIAEQLQELLTIYENAIG